MSAQDFRIGAGAIIIDSEDIGHTNEEGALVIVEPDVHLHQSGKYGSAPVKASLIGRTITIEVTVAEYTLDNMERVYAGVTRVGDKIQFGGVAGVNIPGKDLIIDPFDGSEAWHFTNAVPTSAVESAYSPQDERLMKVTFTALIDENAAEAENLGYFS